MPGLWRQTRHSWAATRGADYAPKWLACGVAGLVYGAGCPYAHQTGAFVVLCCMGLMVFWADFRCFALRWPGLAPAGDILSCHATRKDAKKRAPLPRPLRGCPRSGRAGLVPPKAAMTRCSLQKSAANCRAGGNGFISDDNGLSTKVSKPPSDLNQLSSQPNFFNSGACPNFCV